MPITQYTIIPNPAVPPCGNYCHADASVRQFHFGPLNHSQTYNFAVHADNCGGTQEGRLSNLTVFFGGTACKNYAELILSVIQFPQHEWMKRTIRAQSVYLGCRHVKEAVALTDLLWYRRHCIRQPARHLAQIISLTIIWTCRCSHDEKIWPDASQIVLLPLYTNCVVPEAIA